LIIWMLC